MLYTVTTDVISATRVAIIDAIDARMIAEKTLPQRNVASKIDYLVTFRNRVTRTDAYALGYLATHPVAFDAAFMSHRRSNAMFNIYAMPKCLEVARCLNGGALVGSMGGDNMTLAGTILAIARGTTLESQIAHAINCYAHDLGKSSYSSGGTQASSSLRALEAFGIVRQTGKLGNCQQWGVADATAFARLLDAANGNSAALTTADELSDAAALADSQDSMSREGRAESRADHAVASVASVPESVASVAPDIDAASAGSVKVKRVSARERNTRIINAGVVTMPIDDAGDMIDVFNRREQAAHAEVVLF